MADNRMTKPEWFKGILKRHFLFFLLIPFVVITQLLILEPHLDYGFSDVDWGFLLFYRTSKEQYPNLLSNLINTFRHWGVYTHQSYYIGIQWELFGLNFKSFQLTTHIFKILSILASYPLFYVVSGSSLVAFISVILFAFAYPAVGTMYTVVTSSDYSAVLAMFIFLWFYWLLVKRNKTEWKLLVGLLILLMVTLFLSTERMYPILLAILIGEALLYWIKRSKQILVKGVARLTVLFFPIVAIFLTNPDPFLNFVTNNGGTIIKRTLQGDWHVLLTPFISLGSMLLPHNYWKYLGLVSIKSFVDYLRFFINGPLILFIVSTVVLGVFVFQKSWRFIFQTLVLSIIFAALVFLLGSHRVTHFDSAFIVPALLGFYLLSISIVSFSEWRKNRERLYIGFFAGPIFAFLYIVITWVGADTYLIFTGAHRYLTVPAMAISFFLASVVVLFYKRFVKIRFIKSLAFIPFLVLIPLILMYSKQVDDFFKDQLSHGFGAADQQTMRRQLNQFLSNLSTKEPSLFYFDYSEDRSRGYYYDNTLFGGFKTWMLFHDKINLNKDLQPELLFEPPSGLEILKKSTIKKNNQIAGFKVAGRFYGLENFYAFELKEKKLFDIKREMLETLEF